MPLAGLRLARSKVGFCGACVDFVLRILVFWATVVQVTPGHQVTQLYYVGEVWFVLKSAGSANAWGGGVPGCFLVRAQA